MIQATKRKASTKKQKIQQQMCELDRYDNSLFFSHLVEAQITLSEDHFPKSVSCRDTEKQKIRTFIKNGIQNHGAKQTLYISGVPGIGKTLCVKEVANDIEEDEKLKGNQRKNKFIYLNAMHIKYQKDIFKALLIKLADQRRDSNTALFLLDDFFRKSQGFPKQLYKNKIIIIDEIDYLLTKDMQVLYTLFEWQNCDRSKIILIAISNTIDFPQVLSGKILSRMGNQRIIFKQYSSFEIQKIIKQRIDENENRIFDEKSVEYICKKIARCSSDIRKCLAILRQAISFYLQSKDRKKNQVVPLSFLIEAHESVYNDVFLNLYLSLPLAYKKILGCLAFHFRSEIHSIGFRELEKRASTVYFFTHSDVREIIFSLKDMKIVSIQFSKKVASQAKKKLRNLEEEHINLLITVDKILYAANKDGNAEILMPN